LLLSSEAKTPTAFAKVDLISSAESEEDKNAQAKGQKLEERQESCCLETSLRKARVERRKKQDKDLK